MQFEINPKTGCLSFVDTRFDKRALIGGHACIRYHTEGGKQKEAQLNVKDCSISENSIDDVHGLGKQVSFHQVLHYERVELIYRINQYSQQDFVLIQLTIRNLNQVPIYLHEFCLLQSDPRDGGWLYFPSPSQKLSFLKIGWHGWSYTGLRKQSDYNSKKVSDLLTGISYTNPTSPRPNKPGLFWSEGWGILANDDFALVAGQVSTAHQFAQVYANTGPSSAALAIITQADDMQLDPGEVSDSEWGYIQFVQLPHPEPAGDYVMTVARHMKARVPSTPPSPMWTHWYQYYHDISEITILHNLEALSKLRAIVPIQVVELDDGYQAAWGDWLESSSKFPHGLGFLASNIREQGFIPGLWLAPFTVQSKSKVARQHPEWLLKNNKGKPVRAGFQYNMFSQVFDLSHPAVYDHVREMMEFICQQWKFGMVKVDFVNTAALPGRQFNRKMTRAECLRLGLQAIREGIGENTFLLASGCPFGPAIGIVDAMRIGPDTAPSWEPYFHWLPWSKALISKETSMPSLRNSIRNTLNLSTLHQRWWWNDPDCLIVREIDTNLTGAEVMSAITLVGLSGGMVVSSDDVSRLSQERLHWLSMLVPNLGLRGLPLDCLDHEMPGVFKVDVLPTALLLRGWQLIGVFNWSDRPGTCRVNFCDLGFKEGTVLHLFDFWSESYYRVSEPELRFDNIPAHGCKLLRICNEYEAPQIVGDTMHISGGVEISSWQFVDGILIIDTLDLGRWVKGALWIKLPNKPASATCNGDEIVPEVKDEGIYILPVQFIGKARIEIIL